MDLQSVRGIAPSRCSSSRSMMLASGTAGSVLSAVTKDSLLDPDSIGSVESLSEGSETAGVACASFQARSSSAVGS